MEGRGCNKPGRSRGSRTVEEEEEEEDEDDENTLSEAKTFSIVPPLLFPIWRHDKSFGRLL